MQFPKSAYYWHPISHRFSVIAQYLSNYRFWQPLFNALVLRDIIEYRHKSYVAKTRFFELHFLLQTANPTQFALKSNTFSVITQNNGITPFKIIQGHRFWYQSKAHMRLPISDYY